MTKFAQVRPLGTSFHSPPEITAIRYLHPSHNKPVEIQQSLEKNKTSNCSFSQVKQSAGYCIQANKLNSEFSFVNKSERRRTKSSDSKDYEFLGPYKAVKREVSGSAMQTLDRRISASSDQLDTLNKQRNREKPQRTRSSSRLNSEQKLCFEDSARENCKQQFIRKNDSNRSRNGAKTPFEMFLEDDGPYSRKLYGPLTPKAPRNMQRNHERQSIHKPKTKNNNSSKNQMQIKEKIIYTLKTGETQEEVESHRPVQKGLLWQQKDKFFSRWKERFFILTEDYLQCFKKENSRISEMGPFLFKLKLSDIEDVCLLTKKGYLTISLSHVKDGRVFLRRHEGMNEWYSMIKANALESKANRIQHDLSHNNLNVEAWLLARQTMAGTGNPKPKQNVSIQGKVDSSDGITYDIDDKTRHDMKNIPVNPPKGINRLSMVADLLQSETVAALAHKNSDKQADDSGLESGHTSMNNASDTQSDVGEDTPQ